MNIKIRLIIMNFLQFAVWGAYLTSMGTYLTKIGLGSHIGIFYAMQGIVSLFMPAILGIIADRWIPAQRLLGLSHLLAALFMVGAGYYGRRYGVVSDIVCVLFHERGVLHAYTGFVQLGGVYGTRQGKTRYHQGFPSDSYLWNHRIYLFHVAGRLAEIPG